MKKYLVDLGAGALAGVICFFLGFIAMFFSSDGRLYLIASGVLIIVSVLVYARFRVGAGSGAIICFVVTAILIYLAILTSALWIALSRWQPFL